ncbi:MAG: LPP20 family lipoprotein [Sideroxydans sp.]|nr:LPP20 family lipoprotein [Sideroxydans sp.]
MKIQDKKGWSQRGGRVLLLSLAWLLALPVWAASCAGGGPRPDWIDSPETVTSEYFLAAGVSASAKAALSERIATAKQNALKSLSEMIEVSVKNAIVLEQSSRKTWGSEFTDSSLNLVTQTSTNASLRNVEIIETWEDPRSCDLWLRARVSKRDVDKGKREGLSRMLFAELKAQIAVAQDAAAMPDKRGAALEAAQDILPRISLELVPEAGSAALYESILKGLRSALSSLEQARSALQAADLQVAEAASQTDQGRRARMLSGAASTYKRLLAQYGQGIAGLFESGDILYRLGELETARANVCDAKNYFQQAGESKQLSERNDLARNRAAALQCSEAELEQAAWRQYFEGRAVTLRCNYRTAGNVAVWHKACDALNALIRPLGAQVTISSAVMDAAQLDAMLRGEVPSARRDGEALELVMLADGRMVERAGRDPQSGSREYQFNGTMGSLLLDKGELVLADRFKGVTGWNPVSEEMVMDVLAINMVKRWRGKTSGFLRQKTEQ